MMFTPENTVIGFIGIGVMGKSMASHLLSAGFPMIVYNRSKEKAEELLQKGAIWVSTPKEVAQQANVIFTIVGYPRDVEEIYLGEQGIITNGKPNTYVIDMTTSTPSLAVKIFEEAKKKGIHAIDAPVSGGDIGAREAKLSIMVGGEKEVFLRLDHYLISSAQMLSIKEQREQGQHTKMCNQIAIASNMIGVT